MYDALELDRIAVAEVGQVPIAERGHDDVAERVERTARSRDPDKTFCRSGEQTPRTHVGARHRVGRFAKRRAPPRERVDARDQFGNRERFDEIVIDADVDGGICGLVAALA